ncbi:Chitin-binding type-1 domain-containing protein [Mycena chlorophos]|uniref:Chitin-binding type-1 domain-containing protein n=1 Tax=Mycena chlorophos TaxID=658473 RepID=A0A8H6SF46_MYCCL|nr:Chitin-binding type-1 domain-containing protein [Mycena chlorophos]
MKLGPRLALSGLYLSLLGVVPAVLAQQNTSPATTAPLSQSTLPVGSCTADIPCSNGACCNSKTGYCGYGDAFCKTLADGGPCSSNCNAKAQALWTERAGRRRRLSSQRLLLSGTRRRSIDPVSVSLNSLQYGFCGTTDDFCGKGCQSNCNPPPPKSCAADEATALQRRIGYYEGWSAARPCDGFTPSALNVDPLTHLNFAFGYISSGFEVVEMTAGDSKLWQETTNLKSKNPSLKVFLSIGGWTFNDPPTSGIFSALAGSTANTNTFIKSALSVMNAYSFDGIDIDWEYPVAEDRGGSPDDKANYVTFLKAVKSAFKPFGYGLTFTAPSSYWYLQNYDLPNMLGDDAADWVNVLTYDLHGVWDSPADYIGSIVLAHTNLTEIMATFQLFANVGIDPSRLVMGIGFYGRSFELADPSCTDPGCPFAGAAPAGFCSLSPGTLEFVEIEQIISSQGNADVVFDAEAAVKYLLYNGNDWVSYDDQQTLQMKLQYANSICVSGTVVWSLDQDDMEFTALQGLWGDITDNGVNSTDIVSKDSCSYTACGFNCPPESTVLGKLEKNPITLESCTWPQFSSVCCPLADAPSDCTWRGEPANGGLTCDGSCLQGEINLGMSAIGPKSGSASGFGASVPNLSCLTGEVALCCKTNEDVQDYCYTTDCGSPAPSCKSGYSAKSTVVTIGDETETCPSGSSANLCCEDSVGLKNCAWHGTPPNCLDNGCPVGQTAIWDDYQGDAKTSCVANFRYYCCDTPDTSTFSPVDVSDVFPTSETMGDAVTFTVDFDDNQGPPAVPSTANANSTEGAGSSGLPDDGGENDSPFSSVFISSPNAASVSSLDLESDWVLSNCDASSDAPQTVLAQCSCPVDDDDCGCGHVFIGQANDTIVKMPDSCGLGPYARVVSLAVHPDQRLVQRDISDQPVYSLSFDYEFTAISEDNGPIYMRADMTDMPGYWDSIIDSPPDSGTTSVRKRDFHQPRGMPERRWFGSFTSWLSKINTLTKSDSISRNYHWSDTYTIFHQEESCPNFQSSLDISVTGFASVNTQFGYYLEATIVPPAVQQAYVYFQAGAGAEAAFIITGIASTQWDSGRYELVNFGFPGLYYPGLLTLGPSLHLYGELSGGLSISGTYKTYASYSFPPLDLSFGKQDSGSGQSNFGNPVQPLGNSGGFDYGIGWNVELSGTADAHLIPSLQLGISVLGGSLIDAQVFVEADIFAGVAITGSVSNTVAPNFCITPQIGVNMNAGLTGSVLYWESSLLSANFYSKTSNFPSGCFSSMTEPADGSGSTRRSLISASGSIGNETQRVSAQHARLALPPSPAHAVGRQDLIVYPTTTWEAPGLRDDPVTGTQSKRAIPFLPGSLFCPEVDSDISDAGNDVCDPYQGQLTPLSRRDVALDDLLLSDVAPRALNTTMDDAENVLHWLSRRDSAQLQTCNVGIPIAAYTSLAVSAYYDLADPAQLNGNIRGYASAPPYYTVKSANGQPGLSASKNGQVIYGREHVYEQSMSSLFVDYLAQTPSLYGATNVDLNAFCKWVNTNLNQVPSYMPSGSTSVLSQIGKCYPSLANSRSAGIPVLEQHANVYKQSAFYVTEQKLDPGVLTSAPGIISSSVFQKQCPSNQVATLRSLALVTPFMNSLPAQTAFIRNNDCVRGVWTTWFPLYLKANPSVPITASEFESTYNSWVKDIISGIQGAITSTMDTLIPLYNNGDSTGVDVKLTTSPVLSTWANLNPKVAADAPWTPSNNLNTATSNANLISITEVATSDLKTLRNNVPNINWISQLP